MKANPHFHFPRFFLVLKRDINMGIRPALLSAGAVLGILLIYTFIDGDHYSSPGGEDIFRGYFLNTLSIGGIIITSMAFKELRNNSSRLNYLMLPASIFEKLVSAWFLTSIVYTFLVWFGTIILSWLCMGLSSLYFNLTVQYFEPFSFSTLIQGIRAYWVVNSIFLLGAVIFNKYTFPKIVVSLIALNLLITVIVFFFARIIFWEYFEGFSIDKASLPNFRPAFEHFMEHYALGIARTIFFWVLPIFMWVVTYFHLKERTV